MDGNTSDRATLRGFVDKIEKTYGKAKRMWVMDRGIPSEETSREMREQPPPRLTAQTRITKSRSRPSGRWALCGEDLSMAGADSKALSQLWPLPPAKDRLGPVSSNWKPNPASLRPKSLGCIDR